MFAKIHNNTVVGITADLPNYYNGIFNFGTLSQTDLRTHGYYPFIDQIPQYDPEYQYLTPTYNIEATQVTRTYTVQYLDINECKAKAKSKLRDLRFEKESGGLTLPNGAKIKTDVESQAKVSSAYSALKNGLLTSIDWKAENTWVTLGLTEMTQIATAVAIHVQSCFTNEKLHFTGIDALSTPAEVAAYDITTGWPT